MNRDLGLLEPRLADTIARVCDEVLAGKLADQFVVDPFQAGAGTSHHMNVNEVLANRANEILGAARGAYDPVHPNDHVNFGQSTNDTFPTAHADRGAAPRRGGRCSGAGPAGRTRSDAKGPRSPAIVTAGPHPPAGRDARSCWGRCSAGTRAAVDRARRATSPRPREALPELGIGGTAVGTGVNRHPELPAARGRGDGAATGLALPRRPTIPIAMQPARPRLRRAMRARSRGRRWS